MKLYIQYQMNWSCARKAQAHARKSWSAKLYLAGRKLRKPAKILLVLCVLPAAHLIPVFLVILSLMYDKTPTRSHVCMYTGHALLCVHKLFPSFYYSNPAVKAAWNCFRLCMLIDLSNCLSCILSLITSHDGLFLPSLRKCLSFCLDANNLRLTCLNCDDDAYELRWHGVVVKEAGELLT